VFACGRCPASRPLSSGAMNRVDAGFRSLHSCGSMLAMDAAVRGFKIYGTSGDRLYYSPADNASRSTRSISVNVYAS
jgi:hypothetical protein